MTFVDFMTWIMELWEHMAAALKSISFWGISCWDLLIAGFLISILMAILYGGSGSDS